jgi:dTDP-4-amino-4,6-dideoxygalactose transaminase
MTTDHPPTSLVERLRFPEPVWVTRPCLPPLDEYARRLEAVWDARWLTNFGTLHEELELRLAEFLGVPSLELVSHGTSALLVALKALGLDRGEVITTPFTFPATIHCLAWCGLEPVFCDVEEQTLTLDPERVSERITDKTVAILGVHVYGTPCDTERLQNLSRAHRLPVLYDAAHAFGVRRQGRSILLEGDASILSFHATKLFSTAEGGAAILSDENARKRFRLLRNFGIVDEETVAAPGINAKLSELHAALGLLQLDLARGEIAGRRAVAQTYERELNGLPGLRMVFRPPDVEHNYAYFPILIDEERFGIRRDDLYSWLRKFNVFPRKYFYPLCSEQPLYATLPSSDPATLPIATQAARRALCLPIYGGLGPSAAQRIARILWHLHEHVRDRPALAEKRDKLTSIRSTP